MVCFCTGEAIFYIKSGASLTVCAMGSQIPGLQEIEPPSI